MRGPKQGCVRELPPSHSARISRVLFAVARRFPHYSHERQIRRTKALSAAKCRAGDAGNRFSGMAVRFLPGNMGRNGLRLVARQNLKAGFCKRQLHTPRSSMPDEMWHRPSQLTGVSMLNDVESREHLQKIMQRVESGEPCTMR
jgi:hypothetical protein